MTSVILHTSQGAITLALNETLAPRTVENFLHYVRSGFYAGTLFHRVIPGFMIQGGGLEPGLRPKKTQSPVRNEADNGLRNQRGSVAMARTSDPHSATAQFFINLKDNDFLDHSAPTAQGWGYCVFGAVTEGMDVVDAIARVSTGSAGMHKDVPKEDVLINRAEVISS